MRYTVVKVWHVEARDTTEALETVYQVIPDELHVTSIPAGATAAGVTVTAR